MSKPYQMKFSFTWGLDILEELGFTKLYNFMLRRYTQLGLTRTEMLCLIHLASYHYESPTGQSRPGLATIADQMGYKHRQRVMELISSLEAKNMIHVTRRPGHTSIYNASNFAKACYDALLEEQRRTTQSTPRCTPQSTPPVLPRVHEEDERRIKREEEETQGSRSAPQNYPDSRESRYRYIQGRYAAHIEH